MSLWSGLAAVVALLFMQVGLPVALVLPLQLQLLQMIQIVVLTARSPHDALRLLP
jgi:hypothetical protein